MPGLPDKGTTNIPVEKGVKIIAKYAEFSGFS